MMFGHDDQQQDQDMAVAAPDAVLDQDAPTALPPVSAPADDIATAPATPQDGGAFMVNDDAGTGSVPSNTGDGDLLHIKQQALEQLSPLLGHLNQSADEKFRTTMMLIQASDNANLIPQAYEAAKAISDEKARAQALLDVVNEINYFTQQGDSGSDS